MTNDDDKFRDFIAALVGDGEVPGSDGYVPNPIPSKPELEEEIILSGHVDTADPGTFKPRPRVGPEHMPEAAPLPQRRDPHAGGSKIGRGIHLGLSAVLGALAGGDPDALGYGRRLGRERASEAQRYSDALANRKLANSQRPIGQRVGEATGRPGDMRMDELMASVQAGGNKLASGAQSDRTKMAEGERNRDWKGYRTEDQQFEDRREGDKDRATALGVAEIRARGRRSQGGGSGGGAPPAGATSEEEEAYIHGDSGPGLVDTQHAISGDARNKGGKDFSVRAAALRREAEKKHHAARSHSEKVADKYSSTRNMSRTLRSELHGGGLLKDTKRFGELVAEIQRPGGATSPEARRLHAAIRNVTAEYIRARSGATMTPHEEALFGGRIAKIMPLDIVDAAMRDAKAGSWTALVGATIMGAVRKRESESVTPQDIVDFSNKINSLTMSAMKEGFGGGPSSPRLAWDNGYRRMARSTVASYASSHGGRIDGEPVGGVEVDPESLQPAEGSETLWVGKTADGRPIKVRLYQ